MFSSSARCCSAGTSPRKCEREEPPTDPGVPKNAVWVEENNPGRKYLAEVLRRRRRWTRGRGGWRTEGGVGDAGASSDDISTPPPLSLEARIPAVEHEPQRFSRWKGGLTTWGGGTGTSLRTQPCLDCPRITWLILHRRLRLSSFSRRLEMSQRRNGTYWEMTLSMPLFFCFFGRFSRIGMVKRNLAGITRQEERVVLCNGMVVWVRT